MSSILIPFTPAEVTGLGTPVITQHLPTGAISYNANGEMNIKLPQAGGNRSKYTKKKKHSVGGYSALGRGGSRFRRLKRTKKINRHRRTKTYSAGGKQKSKKHW